MGYNLYVKRAVVSLLMAGLIVAGGFAVIRASSVGPDGGTIRTCTDTHGNIRLLDQDRESQCKKNETLVGLASAERVYQLEMRVAALEVTPSPTPSPTPTPTPDPLANYQAVRDILGPTGVILPLVNVETGNFGPTFQAIGAIQPTFTWSGLPFDTLPSTQGSAPMVTFNGTDEGANTLDAAYWTRALAPFSIGVWVKPTAVASRTLLAKWDETAGAELREWQLFVGDTSKLEMVLYDETANTTISRYYNTPLVVDRWYHVVGVYDGGATNAAIKLYLDGVRIDDRDNGGGVFVTMQDTATLLRLAHKLNTAGAAAEFVRGSMAGGPSGPFFTQIALTADQVLQLYQLGRTAMGL